MWNWTTYLTCLTTNNLIITNTHIKKDSTLVPSVMILNNKLEYISNNPIPNSVKTSSILDKFIYKNHDIFRLMFWLWYPDSIFSNWTYLFPDTTTGMIDQYGGKPVYNWLNLGSWNIYKDNIYCLYHKLSKSAKFIYPVDLQAFGWSNYDLGIQKYDELTDSLIPINNMFINNYYSSKEESSIELDEVTHHLSKPFIHNDSVFILYGKYNTILVTPNTGKDWKLVSNLIGNPKLIIDDSIFYFFDNEKNGIYRTYDGGITFSPMQIVDTVSYLQKLSNVSLFYIDSTGNGFLGGYNIQNHGNAVNSPWKPGDSSFAITKDGGRTFKFMSRRDIKTDEYFMTSTTNICKINDNYLFALNFNTSPDTYNFYIMDANDYSLKLINKNSNCKINYILACNDSLKDNIAHFYVFATNTTEEHALEIRETNDSGCTFQVISKIGGNIDIKQFYEHNGDSVFFVTDTKIYLYDRIRNSIDTLFSTDIQQFFMNIMCLSNHFFIVGDNIFLENSDRNDLTKWQIGKWDYGKPSFTSVIFKGDMALANFNDSLRPQNNYKIIYNCLSTVVNDNKTETYYGHFYADNPIPNPVNSVVRSNIWWDNSLDIDNAIAGIFDIYGQKIAPKESVIVTKSDGNHGILELNCSSFADGVYFIAIKNNINYDIIVVVVEK